MKKIKQLQLIVLFLALYSCKPTPTPEPDEASGLVKIQTMTNDTHEVTLYSTSGILQEGYNDITLRILDKTTGKYVFDMGIDWLPFMKMTMSTHSCPKSPVVKVAKTKALYRGAIIFQMPDQTNTSWELKIRYRIGQTDYVVKDRIAVHASDKKTVTTFLGADQRDYVVAYVAPQTLTQEVNDMVVGLFVRYTPMNFEVVDNYTLKIDPRMPSMANHGSTSTTTLTQPILGEFYKGSLSLNMAGDWVINLQILNTKGEVIAGEAVTPETPKSRIYFDVGF